jgi:uncharacterized RDD family membrane protein YckC
MKYAFKRIVAYLIDCLICYSVIMLLIQWAILSHLRTEFGLTNEWFQSSLNMELYVLLTISFPTWFYFVYFDSNKSNGTMGKRIMRLSVFDFEMKKLTVQKSFQRTFLKLLPWEIAHAGVIFPVPLYFAQDGDVRLLTIVGLALCIIYSVSLFTNTRGQSIYDIALKTHVLHK